MGGRVLFALSIAAFPEELPTETLGAVFAGASAKVREAGGVLAGGHTIRDPEPKYGLAVTGAGHPDRLLRKGAAQPGDVLLLTKRLGTGLLVSGRRQGRTSEADFSAAIDQMRTLNRAASEVFVAAGVHAATDVTGFGLLGHGLEMARGSGTRFVFEAARDAAARRRAGSCPRRCRDRRRRPQPPLRGRRADARPTTCPPELVTLAHDPQTSGGLLAAVGPDRIDEIEAALDARSPTGGSAESRPRPRPESPSAYRSEPRVSGAHHTSVRPRWACPGWIPPNLCRRERGAG